MRRLPLFRPPQRHIIPLCTAGGAAAGARKSKIIVIMGQTGSGKSKLSVDLASRFFPASEIVNSDKIQVYRGLDITTNRIPIPERKNVPHYLLGEFDPSASHPEFTPSDFRSAASSAISRILARRKIPFVVGGSNSYVYALLAKKFDQELDVFAESSDSAFCKELRYRCCFIWVDASPTVLSQYLVKRVDDMLNSGMFEELSQYFADPESESASQCGLHKAIGVPEFRKYFQNLRKKPEYLSACADMARKAAYEEQVKAIKDNTCQLAKKQLGKILRLRDAAGWDIKRVDATEALRAAMGSGGGRRRAEIWEKQVLQPSVKIVQEFLMD